MPVRALLFKALRDLRWQTFWYGIGLALMGAMVVFVYPSYSKQLGDFQIPEAFKPLLGDSDFTSPEGFLSGEFFGWTPIIMVIFAIMAGSAALAGEEASGTLDLLLSQPVSRRAIALTKMCGIAISSLIIAVVICAGWSASVPFVDIDISFRDLVLATLNIVPLTLFFASLAMFAGVTASNRSMATGLVTGFAVVSFFFNYLGALVDILSPLRWLSPFFYYHGADALSDGVDLLGLAVISLCTVAFAVGAVIAFERRDIGVVATGGSSPRFRLSRRSDGENDSAT